jgi:tRNA guanosine-2'-O-methyltransferase
MDTASPSSLHAVAESLLHAIASLPPNTAAGPPAHPASASSAATLESAATALNALLDEADGASAAAPPAAAAAPPGVWWSLLHALLSRGRRSTPHMRQTCLAAFRRALDGLERAAEAAGGGPTTTTTSSPQYSALLTLFEALEDFPAHLLEEVWRTKLPLILVRGGGDSGASLPSPSAAGDGLLLSPCARGAIPIPSLSLPLPFEWAALVLDRAFFHENPLVCRVTMGSLLRLPDGYPSPALEALSAPADDLRREAAAGDTSSAGAAPPSSSPFRIVGLASYSCASTPAVAAASRGHDAGSSTKGGVGGVGMEAGLGLLLPPWYVADARATHLLGGVQACAAAFGGGTELLSRSLHDFLVAYVAQVARMDEEGEDVAASAPAADPFSSAAPLPSSPTRRRARTPFLPTFLRSLVASLRAVAQCKSAAKWVARALAALPAAPAASQPLLDAPAVANLRAFLVDISGVVTRAAFDDIQRSLLDGLLAGTPASSLPVPDLALTLAGTPAALVLRVNRTAADTAASRHGRVVEWLRGGDDERGHALLVRDLAAAEALYLRGPPPPPPSSSTAAGAATSLIPMSATALARLAVLLLPLHSSPASTTLPALLPTLTALLPALHTHAYLPAATRRRALLLAQALVLAAWPGGGRGDAHFARVPQGSSVHPTPPSGSAAWAAPLYAEWEATSRVAARAYPDVAPPPQVGRALSVPLDHAGDPDDLGGRLLARTPAQEAVAALLGAPDVAADLAAVLESGACADASGGGDSDNGDDGSSSGGGSTSASASGAGDAQDVGSPTCLALLADLALVLRGSSSPRVAAGAVLFHDAAERIVTRAATVLEGPQTAPGHVARAAHQIAVLGGVLRPDSPARRSALRGLLSREALPPRAASGSGGAQPSSETRTFFLVCRWVAVGRLLSGGMPDASDFAALAASVSAGLEACPPDALPALFGVAGRVIGPCRARSAPNETAEDIAAAVAVGEGLDSVSATRAVAAAASSGVVVDDLAEQLFAILRTQRLSRTATFALLCALVRPSTFLRPSLHIGTNGAGAGGALARLLSLRLLPDMLSEKERRPAYCTQIIAARLVAVWRTLLSVASAAPLSSSASVAAAGARRVFLAHCPLAVRLLLHREPCDTAGYHEESPLGESASRAQMLAWVATTRGKVGGGEAPASSSADAATAAAAMEGEMGVRGAGSLTRLQVLVWLDEVADMASAEPRGGNGPATALTRHLLVRLARLCAREEMCGEVLPGSSVHLLQLRAWQAICILARSWGRDGEEDGLAGESEAAAAAAADSVRECSDRLLGMGLPQPAETSAAATAHGKKQGGVGSGRAGAGTARFAGRKGKGGPTVEELVEGPWDDEEEEEEEAKEGAGAGTSHALFRFVEAAPSAAVATAVARAAFARQLAGAPQLASSRQYMEAVTAALCRRFPSSIIRTTLLPYLETPNGQPKAQLGFSTVLVAGDFVMYAARRAAAVAAAAAAAEAAPGDARVSPPPPPPALLERLLHAVFAWNTSPVAQVRLIAQTIIATAVPLLYGPPPPPGTAFASGGGGGVGGVGPSSSAWLWSTVRMILDSPQTRDAIDRQAHNFLRLDPSRSTTLATILSSPPTEHGEIVPVDLCSLVKASMDEWAARTALHEEAATVSGEDLVDVKTLAAIAAGLAPQSGTWDQSRLGPFGLAGADGGEGPFGAAPGVLGRLNSAETTAGASLQRKVRSAAEALGLSAAASSPSASVLTSSTPAPSPDLPPRRHQPVVIVASLVTKMPNLAGLARTAEIFGAESLVVHDSAAVAADAYFKGVAMTSTHHLPLHTCGPDDLLDYVRARKALGYRIVALEQSYRSVRLGSAACVLPDGPCAIVLGAEGEGVPAALLGEADVVVEIPQFGLIRSLNVHVSGALLLWEYTRQRTDRRQAGAGGV